MSENMNRICDLVSSKTSFDEALQALVKLVKQAMKAGVASVFLTDDERQDYVLMATDGLRPSAVGQVRIKYDQGLVGLVGRREEPLNLALACCHPQFFQIADTGEDAYSSMLSVPLMHRKKVFGVLVVLREQEERFSSSDERFLMTLASRVSHILPSSEARSGVFSVNNAEPQANSLFYGTVAATGIGIGRAVVVGPSAMFQSVEERRIDDLQAEIRSFDLACQEVRADLQRLKQSVCEQLEASELGLFDVYMSMLEDDAFVGKVYRGIEQGSWAGSSLRRVVETTVDAFNAMEDEYFRAKASDILDLGVRLLKHLLDMNTDMVPSNEPVILIGDDVSATTLLEWPRHTLAGVISLKGTSNSHMAIIARAIELPAVVGIMDLPMQSMQGKAIILDGFRAQVIVNPSPDYKAAYEAFIRQERVIAKGMRSEFDLPSQTACGVDIKVLANTGFITDAKLALQRGAMGVGLLRTEISFMEYDSFPSEAEQAHVYRQHLACYAPRPVSMRTLDIGGDKALPYFPISEANPFLGWRGVRVTLDHPDIFAVQVRAMLRASEGFNNLRILVPMVIGLDEVDQVLALIHRAYREIREEGFDVVMPKIGVMLEVPAAVLQARAFAKKVDFLSIGTNDLIQYLLAVDRNNAKVAHLYDPYHPAVIQTLDMLARSLKDIDVDINICGEIAGNPAIAPLLVGMGYRCFSMSASSLLRVKWVLRRLTLVQMIELVTIAKQQETAYTCQKAVLARLDELGVGRAVQKYPAEPIAKMDNIA